MKRQQEYLLHTFRQADPKHFEAGLMIVLYNTVNKLQSQLDEKTSIILQHENELEQYKESEKQISDIYTSVNEKYESFNTEKTSGIE